jgi:mannose-6-phosphate isomerase-like protein (cupin superfamily)
MIKSGTVVAGPHTCIEFERTSADTHGALLSFKETFQVGPQRPPMHLHATQTERFTVLTGTLGVRIGRETRVLGPGETVEVAPGTAHTLWNAGDQVCVHRVEMMPALAMEDFFYETVTIEAEGGVPPTSLAQAARLAALLLRHRNQLHGLPWFVQRVLFGLLVLLSPKRDTHARLGGTT